MGNKGPTEVANGHVLKSILSARGTDSIVDIDPYHFVFQHLNNSETKEAIKTLFDQGRKARVIGFTAGEVPEQWHKLSFPCIGSLLRVSILRWAAVPRDFSGTADELVEILVPRVQEMLTALAILCQGYLSVDAISTLPGTPPVLRML